MGSNTRVYNTDIIGNTISYSMDRGINYNQCYVSQNGQYLTGIDMQGDHCNIIGNTVTNFAVGMRLNNITDNQVIIDSNNIWQIHNKYIITEITSGIIIIDPPEPNRPKNNPANANKKYPIKSSTNKIHLY